MYKNTLNSSLGESLSSMEWKITKISLELKLHFLHPPTREVLALRVVFGHEALGVLPRVDGRWIELSVPERRWWGLVGDNTGRQHCRLRRLAPRRRRGHPWSETKHWVGEVSILVVDSCVRLRKRVITLCSLLILVVDISPSETQPHSHSRQRKAPQTQRWCLAGRTRCLWSHQALWACNNIWN